MGTKQGSLLSGAQRRQPGRTSLRTRRFMAEFVSARARLAALVLFILLVGFLGGSSRPDVPGLIVLRPLAVLFCGYALLAATGEHLRNAKGALLLVGSLMILALVQLIPLPSGLWRSLPGRGLVAEASVLVGSGADWRPLSLDPNRTWNAFFALFVALATVCLVAIQESRWQRKVLAVLLALGILSGALGLLQSIGGSGLHFYDITHRGYPVGLFANKNHQAVLLLWVAFAASFMAATADPHRHSARVSVGGALAAIAVLLPLLILTGSRAGLLLSLPTMTGCAWLLFKAPATSAFLPRNSRRTKLLLFGAAILAAGLIAFVFTMLALSARQTALSRLFELSAGDDLRSLYFSRFVEMAQDYFPVGSGLGSFQDAFNLYEPAEHLTAYYMNLAHNEPIQLLIEGGLPALLIMSGGLIWTARAGWRMWSSTVSGPFVAVFYCGSIALWLAASLVDYPLRTPLAATLFVALTTQLSILSTRDRSSAGLPSEAERARSITA